MSKRYGVGKDQEEREECKGFMTMNKRER